jgi:SsrA-binding protein
MPIKRCLILAKHLCRKAFARVPANHPNATIEIRGIFALARQTSHVIAQPKAPAGTGPKKPRDPVAAGERDAAQNRAANHNYFLLDKVEAGLALRGTEVKSIREGKANLKDAYGLIKDDEAFLLNLHIGPYSHGNISNHDETRTRKLLLHREEVRKLQTKTQIKGHTLIPTRLYFRNGRVKCELAVAKGKQDWDKRETERRREADREARAAINNSKRRNGN